MVIMSSSDLSLYLLVASYTRAFEAPINHISFPLTSKVNLFHTVVTLLLPPTSPRFIIAVYDFFFLNYLRAFFLSCHTLADIIRNQGSIVCLGFMKRVAHADCILSIANCPTVNFST